MSAVPVTIVGVECDKWGRTIRPVTIMGMASITGLEVGGGPIIPPEGPGSGPGGDHIWGGGNVPMPSPPIANVPGAPGYNPPGRPGEIIPPKPTAPPQSPDQPVPPAAAGSPNAGWAWHPAYGWGFFPPNQAVPKK